MATNFVVLPITQYHYKLLHYNAKMQIRWMTCMVYEHVLMLYIRALYLDASRYDLKTVTVMVYFSTFTFWRQQRFLFKMARHTSALFDKIDKEPVLKIDFTKMRPISAFHYFTWLFCIFCRNWKHRFGCEQDISELKIWYQSIHNTIIHRYMFKVRQSNKLYIS